MKYGVYNVKYREHVRWYVRPVGDHGPTELQYVFDGEDARVRACVKAMELNDREGRTALVA